MENKHRAKCLPAYLGIGTCEAALPAVVQQFLFQQVILFFSRVKVIHGHELVPQLLQPVQQECRGENWSEYK